MAYNIGHLSPYENRFNALIQRFVEYGFFKLFHEKAARWLSQMPGFSMAKLWAGYGMNMQASVYTNVSLSDIHDGLLMLLIGWPVALIAFFGEILWWRFRFQCCVYTYIS